jgi:hypothetical protein
MDVAETAWVAILAVGLVGAVLGVVVSAVRLRRAPDDRMVRFAYGWLATFAVLAGMCCSVGLAAALGDLVQSSPAAFAGVVAINALAQPVAAAFVLGGLGKLAHGLRGRVAVAWRRVPDEQLTDLSPGERRQVAWACVTQGVIVLPLGVGLSYCCGWPLVRWALA